MPLSKDVMGGGLSAQTAQALAGTINTTVSAAGSSQSDATELSASINSVTTVASGAGVKLPACEIGDDVWVYNGQVTNPLTVYPDSGATINQLSANTSITLPAYTGILCKRVTSTAWLAIRSA